jgi:hypothetical protein
LYETEEKEKHFILSQMNEWMNEFENEWMNELMNVNRNK